MGVSGVLSVIRIILVIGYLTKDPNESLASLHAKPSPLSGLAGLMLATILEQPLF